jgi:hypothetical protein
MSPESADNQRTRFWVENIILIWLRSHFSSPRSVGVLGFLTMQGAKQHLEIGDKCERPRYSISRIRGTSMCTHVDTSGGVWGVEALV